MKVIKNVITDTDHLQIELTQATIIRYTPCFRGCG